MNPPPYPALLAGLGILLLRRQGSRAFTVPGTPPDWFRPFGPATLDPGAPIEPATIFLFLDHFLEAAEPFWAARGGGELRSGIWTEETPEGTELHFEAVACRAEGADFLLIRRLTNSFERMQHAFQKGRELSLTHERLITEIGKKDILLHCIIHDISGPLQGMVGALEIAEKEMQTAQGKRLVKLGLLAGNQQSNMIHDLLDIFRFEVSTGDVIAPDPATTPEILRCAGEVLAVLQPALAVRGLIAKVIPPAGTAAVPVIAEKGRLERVFYNLLQNAMRHSPRGGNVTISMGDEDGFVRTAIDDDGPGIPPEVAPQLFQKFVRDGNSRGKAGLGLFFCRITVEQWGGTIGCEPRPRGGTRFWFRLKKV